MRLLGELDALFPEICRNRVNARNRKAEMIEALIRRRGRRIYTITCIDLGGEDHGAAELDVDARLALLRRTDDFCPEHPLEPLRHPFRIGCAQVNVIPG